MMSLRQIIASWRQDNLLRRVVRNSGYLFSSNTVSAVLSFAQGIFATRLLGVDGYGLVSGTIVIFATNVNRLFSFRMSEVVVQYLGRALVEGKKDRAGAVVKGAALVEATMAVIAYLILFALAPLAARYLAKDQSVTHLFVIYGLILLSNIVFETSTGVLQATKRFDRIALINLIQSIIVASLIFLAFLARLGVLEVLLAYLLGKTFMGTAMAVSAFRQLNKDLGSGWQKSSLRLLTDWRAIARFAISTNLSGTVNLVVRDSETLLVAFFMTTTEAGYFRLAQGLINLVMMPVDPLIDPTYSEITGTIARREWSTTQRLLRRVSTIAGAWTLVAGGSLALFGWWFVPFLYGVDAAPAYPALAILLIGYGFANVLQWNRPLLLALGKPTYPLIVVALAGLVKTGFSFWLVPRYGYLVEAGILSAYFVASISILVWRGLREIHWQSTMAEQQ